MTNLKEKQRVLNHALKGSFVHLSETVILKVMVSVQTDSHAMLALRVEQRVFVQKEATVQVV